MDGETASQMKLPTATSALPSNWIDSWGEPASRLRHRLTELRESIETLAADLTFVDRSGEFRHLVGSADLRDAPIHRWYYYKEGFSPNLPDTIVAALGTGTTGTVVDSFAGVGTTALSLRRHHLVNRVIGVEYSPFATFVGQAKLASITLDPDVLTNHINRLAITPHRPYISPFPLLSSFHNAEIFSPDTLTSLIAIRDLVRNDRQLSDPEQSFFLLGIVAVLEDLSNAMKDGRALRILRGRVRRKQGLTPTTGAVNDDSVIATIVNQWRAMVEDIRLIREEPSDSIAIQVQGDARSLRSIKIDPQRELIPDNSVGLYLYSPPYLNFIDYTEVYKLELWFLEFVTDQAGFRSLREGTMRSHPSIQFPQRERSDEGSKVFQVVESITNFLVDELARPATGNTPELYFADMYEVLKCQFKTLESGGAVACIVANSTFSRRTKPDKGRVELWRLPLLTDVIIARLAEAAGFVDIEIWCARTLQAKNVNSGFARESIVIARKPVS